MVRLLVAAAWSVIAAGLLAAQSRPSSCSDEEREMFALLDRFDPLATEKLPFVKVVRRWVLPSGDKCVQERHGFLLREAPTRLVRYLDLEEEDVVPGPVAGNEDDTVEIVPAVLADYVREVAKQLEPKDLFANTLGLEHWVPPLAMGVLVARACDRRGLHVEAAALWRGLSRHSEVAEELGTFLRERVILEFGSSRFSYDDLLRRLRLWTECFPEHSRLDDVGRHIAEVERRIAELRAVSAASRPEGPRDLARRLVVELRDETSDTCDAKGSASSRLLALGLDAVPALLDAFDDRRLTRRAGHQLHMGSNFGPPWCHIDEVWQVARSLLGTISGIDDSPDRLGAWKEWWALVQANGEAAAVAEFARRGDFVATHAAERLVDRWPERIEDAIAGLWVTQYPGARVGIIAAIAKVPGERTSSCLRAESEDGPKLAGRVAAAQRLLERRDRHGLEALLWLWPRIEEGEEKGHLRVGLPELASLEGFDVRELACCLGAILASGDVEAVRDVCTGLAFRPQGVQLAMLEALELFPPATRCKKLDARDRARVEAALEDALMCLLGSTSAADWMGYEGSRWCDRAAVVCGKLWPERARFDPWASTRVRDRQVVAIQNAWRARAGWPLLAVERQPIPADDAELRALLQTIRDSRDATDEQQQRLAARGLSALSALEDLLTRLPAEAAARRRLEPLVARLANTVRQVRVDSGTSRLTKELDRKIQLLKDRTLDAAGVVGLFLAAVHALPESPGEIDLEIDRVGDGTGIVVVLRIAAGPVPSHSQLLSVVQSGGEKLLDTSDALRHELDDEGKLEEQAKAITKALAVDRRVPFSIRLRVRLE